MFATPFNQKDLEEAVNTIYSQSHIKFKSFACFECGEIFIFEPTDEQGKNYEKCIEHWHLTKLHTLCKIEEGIH